MSSAPGKFERALDVVLKHEGGYVNHPDDPGGETIYGISKKAHPSAWANGTPTIEEAKEIYRKGYWIKIHGDKLPDSLALFMFDAAVNMGVYRATIFLQDAVGAKKDGLLGPKTLSAVEKADEKTVLVSMAAERQIFYSSRNTWNRFGQGWTKRNMDVLAESILEI